LRIAFVRDVEYPADEEAETEAITAPELFVADLNNLGAAQQLTTLGQQGATVVASPTWSPEGTEIIFVSNLNSEDTELVYIRADGEGLRVLTDNDSIDRDPAWQPVFGSRALAITSDQDSPGLTEIYLFELGDSLDNVTYTRLTDASNSSYDPSWSADATQIAFISNRRGDADVYVMNADGSGATLVTVDDGDAEDRSPSFTPDGRLILFLSNREADRFQIYAASADRRVFLRLTDSNRNEQSAVYLPENDLR
jgi:TolB protein